MLPENCFEVVLALRPAGTLTNATRTALATITSALASFVEDNIARGLRRNRLEVDFGQVQILSRASLKETTNRSYKICIENNERSKRF